MGDINESVSDHVRRSQRWRHGTQLTVLCKYLRAAVLAGRTTSTNRQMIIFDGRGEGVTGCS
jgi:hypothetical protein